MRAKAKGSGASPAGPSAPAPSGPSRPEADLKVRRAAVEDSAEIVRLAEAMFRSLGIDPKLYNWERFRTAAAQALEHRRDDTVAFVVDHPALGGGLVACGAGVVMRRLPTVGQPDGRVGYIQWMSTDPAYRRHGLARRILRELLAWFEGLGIDNVELHASPDGAPLYRSEGFWRGTGGEALRRRPWDPPPA